ncbi:flagellar motor switch protein FliM [Actinotalea sp. K2]|uniref:flagellar motor switch protein FliM n=1 Tax=Actinotalea sp. K2 TaxID=2939438 RepID=UPI00201733A3|nr:flagellar motor switch protein FliM [Actinotalea sp. K2]MCL3860868.1 flagellar motor switch protein FliM [Actinotalea sp. K2]
MTVQDTMQPPARRKRSAEPEPYDFRRPMTLAREHGRVLEMAFETFARQWGTQLTSRLRVVAQVGLESVEMRSYDEYVRSLEPMTTMVLCSVENGRSTAVLQLPIDSTMLWIDYLLGGPGIVVEAPDRELTEIEWHLLRELLQHALADLTYAFASVCPLDVAVKTVQYNPQFVQAVAASEPVIIATFELHVGDRTSIATLMAPAEVMLSSMRAGEKLDNRSAEEVRAHRVALERISDQVHGVPVDVSVRFAGQSVTAGVVSRLAVGDVLPLHHRADKPLDIVVDDVVLGRAAIGANGSRLACLVVTSEEKS